MRFAAFSSKTVKTSGQPVSDARETDERTLPKNLGSTALSGIYDIRMWLKWQVILPLKMRLPAQR